MRFSVDDGRLGFIVTSLPGRGMFRFQVVMADQIIGDAEPSIITSAMLELSDLHRLTDERLARATTEPAAVLSMLLDDEDLHDVMIRSIAESLDQWLMACFVYDGNVVVLAREYHDDESIPAPTLVASVGVAEYDELIGLTREYWSEMERRDGFRVIG